MQVETNTNTASGFYPYLGQAVAGIKEKVQKIPATGVFFLYTILSLLFKSVLIVGIVNQTDFLAHTWLQVSYVVPTYMVYVVFLLMFVSLSLLLTGRRQLWYIIGFNFVVSAILLCDLWYFRGFGTFISVHVLKQYINLYNLTGSILSMINVEDIIYVWDLPIMVFLAATQKTFYQGAKRRVALWFLMLASSIVYLSYEHYVHDISPERGHRQYLFRMCWAPTQTITDLSPIGFHLFDSYIYLTDCQQLLIADADQKEIDKWYEDKQEHLPKNAYAGMFKGKNLIIIQVESLEGFYLKNEIGGEEITPNLNRMLNNSIYFADFVEQVNGGTTADAELMGNTSIYPVRVGATYLRYPDNTYNSMPKLFGRMGYTVSAIHPDNRGYWNWMQAMKGIGYETCIDSTYFNIDEVIGLGLSDESFFRQVEPMIKEQKQPFFNFMITLTNHGPFELPDKYKTLKVDEKFEGTKMGASFHTVHYTDAQIGKFINKLDEDGLLDNTVVVIYGDHNAAHKFYTDEIPNIKPVDDWWFDNHHRIPFLIYQKNMRGEEVWTKGGHVDILPTVAYVMGVDEQEYAYSAMGRNLLNTQKDFAVLNTGQFLGTARNSQEEEHAVHGLELADKLIRSSYFGIRQ